MSWNPFGVLLEISATAGTVERISATQYTVNITASWECYYSGAKTIYGMSAISGGATKNISSFGTSRAGGSATFKGTYSISGNGAQTKSITVTFKNYEEDWQGNVISSKTQNITLNVKVPALTSYAVKYNANGGSGAPSAQTKWKDQKLTLSSTKPTRTGYSFLGWSTSSTATSATYSAGGSYTANAAATLYAVWKANTYTVTYNANGGTLGSVKTQTKAYGKALALTGTATRSGYNFKGWATTANAVTANYQTGSNYTGNAAITLYAVWEIAYQKPTISNLIVSRCTEDEIITDEGTYLLFQFDWSCYEPVSEISLYCVSTDDTISEFGTVEASGTSGSIRAKIGNGAITTDKTFTAGVTVTDSQSTTKTTNIDGDEKAIEAVRDEDTGEYGVSFGKPAELTGVADFGYEIISSHGELITSPVELKENADLNELLTNGHYVIPTTTVSVTVQNKPLWLNSGTENATAYITVASMGNGLQKFQRYYWCSKTNQLIFQRVYYTNAWGEWAIVGGCTDWKALTISSGFEAYTANSTEPKYRVNGNLVTISGALKPTAAVESGTTDIQLCGTLPAQYRPPYSQSFICQGSGINRWLLTVKSNGNIYVGRYGTNDYVDIPTGAWLTFSVTYSI